jgi:hypothetical protein
MNNMRWIPKLIMISSLLCCAQAQAQALIYSLSYGETTASRHARFPNGGIGVPINERLAILRSYRKTEIYSVSVIDGKRTLLFSDEGMNLDIRPTGPTYGADKVLVMGVMREWRTTPIPGAYEEPPAIYEISLDGSKQFRKLFEPPPNQLPALLNPQGKKAVFQAFQNEGYVISVYALPAWKLLQSWKLSKLTQAHCPSCTPLSYGWLADGERLFFDLGVNGEDDEASKNGHGPGTYIASEDGADLGSIPPETGHVQLAGYIRPSYIQNDLIAQLPDGNYLFRDHAAKREAPGKLEPFLVISSPDSRLQKQFPQKFSIGSGHISASGKYLAYIEERQTPNYRTERHLWVKDLQSGEEKELFSVPPPNLPTSPEPSVYLTVLGWANN